MGIGVKDWVAPEQFAFGSTLELLGLFCQIYSISSGVSTSLPPCREKRRCGLYCDFRQAISIHAPHAGSDEALASVAFVDFISIHAPHAGSDCNSICSFLMLSLFQSTLPMRGATLGYLPLVEPHEISIHAPHAGSDGKLQCYDRFTVEFQSTLPMRGATSRRLHPSPSFVFQSTLPMRGATYSGSS